MAKVRGASLSDEAVELGFWAVAGQIMGITRDSVGNVELPPGVRAEIAKRYQGDLESLLAGAVRARTLVAEGEKMGGVSAARYERERVQISLRNAVEAKPGSAAWPPGVQTVMARFGEGSWSRALGVFGLSGAAQGRELGSGRLTRGDFEEAVGRFTRDCELLGRAATYAEYGRWAKEEKASGRPRPSGSTLRQRYGSWSAALHLTNEAD